MKVSPVKSRKQPALERIFNRVRSFVSRRFPELRSIKLYSGCPDAERSHRHLKGTRFDKDGHSRYYMHWGHIKGFVCTSSHVFRELKKDELYGIFLHEFGHALADLLGITNSQDQADGLIWKYFRIP